jgi:hypothetical protein
MKRQQKDIIKPLQNEAYKNNAGADFYPLSTVNEDIYYKSVEEVNINPEDVTKLKDFNQIVIKEQANEIDPIDIGFTQYKSGDDLDVPGAELDDEQEAIGNEDEENNYYSLGGDNHNDVDDDRD